MVLWGSWENRGKPKLKDSTHLNPEMTIRRHQVCRLNRKELQDYSTLFERYENESSIFLCTRIDDMCFFLICRFFEQIETFEYFWWVGTWPWKARTAKLFGWTSRHSFLCISSTGSSVPSGQRWNLRTKKEALGIFLGAWRVHASVGWGTENGTSHHPCFDRRQTERETEGIQQRSGNKNSRRNIQNNSK